MLQAPKYGCSNKKGDSPSLSGKGPGVRSDSPSLLRRSRPQWGKGLGVRFCALAALLVLTAGIAAAVYAQAGGGYDLSWNTVDTGGATFAAGGGYTLSGTAGQPDAATWAGGGYRLTGGFWHAASAGATPGGADVYLPIVVKQ